MDKEYYNRYSMEPTKQGAYIEIRVIRETWSDALKGLNDAVKDITNTIQQMKKDDPVSDWKFENDRWMKIVKEKAA